jgi:hypothetical protein
MSISCPVSVSFTFEKILIVFVTVIIFLSFVFGLCLFAN